jgi:hypothetical protein
MKFYEDSVLVNFLGSSDWDDEVQVPEDKVQWITKTLQEWEKVQDYIRELKDQQNII